MLSARETCGGDMNGVGFNPFENMLFGKNKFLCANSNITASRCGLPGRIFQDV